MLRFSKHLRDNYQLSEKEWNCIQPYFEPLSLEKNEFFVQKGKVCHRLAFIEEGIMRYCMERNGEDITCYFVCENSFAGDPDSFFSHKPSERNMQALTGCRLITFSRENLEKIHAVNKRFKDITVLIDHNVTMELMLQRDFLMHGDAAAKYRHFIEHYPHILQRVPLGYIASFLGITQQSLSRLRKQMS